MVRKRSLFLSAVLALSLVPAFTLTGAQKAPPETAPSQRLPGTSTVDDQVQVAVTAYNSGIALVRDVREVAVAAGESELRFEDIAATVNPATVHLRSLSEPSRIGVLEQNYEYDLLEPAKLLRKYVGREVTLVRTVEEGGATKQQEVRAQLVSDNNGPIWKIGNEYVTGMPTDHLRFPELPANLYSRPTLVWKLENRGGAKQRLETSYLAGGVSWNADYVLTVARDEKTADLDGWVTLVNNSGALFRGARLQLVAGDVNRVRPAAKAMDLVQPMMRGDAAAPAMAQEAFSEYHLYTLQRPTTIANAETKQVSMLNGTGVPVDKRYAVYGQQFYYRNRTRPGLPLKDDVHVFYRFRNDEKSSLGMPMPAGIVRVYQADSKGGVQFVGEDRIDHTPKDETLDLEIGRAFDVVCERNQVDFRKIDTNTYEMEFEIVLRNHKAIPISVSVNEPIGGTWEMLKSTHQWKKTAAWAAEFQVPVAAESTATLRYRVRVTY